MTTDRDLQQQVLQALEWDSALPEAAIKATVRNGWVTLSGSVPWQYQKAEAERAAWAAPGVTKVDDRLVVVP